MPEICVVHLARQENGPEPFERFITSYRRFPVGVPHTLVIIFKGFGERPDLRKYEELLAGVDHESFFVTDEGYDILPYLKLARERECRYFCFLNSFSVLLDEGWLLKMYRHIESAGVGVVGATGSYESLFTTIMQSWPSPRWLTFWLKMIVRQFDDFRRVSRWRLYFQPFPNPHVRTNAFLISREILLKLRVTSLIKKDDVYRFESGRNGMTQQILSMGLRPLVVGRDGLAYEKEYWKESRTFRSGSQENLLVADNQTRYYDHATIAEKQSLVRSTWGTVNVARCPLPSETPSREPVN